MDHNEINVEVESKDLESYRNLKSDLISDKFNNKN